MGRLRIRTGFEPKMNQRKRKVDKPDIKVNISENTCRELNVNYKKVGPLTIPHYFKGKKFDNIRDVLIRMHILDSVPKPEIWRYEEKFSYRGAKKEEKKAFKKDFEKAKKRLVAMETMRPLLAENKNDSRMNDTLKARMKSYENGVEKIAEIEQFIIWCREISGISG